MIDIVDSASVSQLTLAVETKSPTPTAPIEDTIAAFVVATNTGMFSKTPSAQTTPIIVEASESSAERCEYVWRSTGVQMGAYRVLIGMLDAANQLGAELESVRLVSSADRGAFPKSARTVLWSCPGKQRIRAAMVSHHSFAGRNLKASSTGIESNKSL